MQVECSILYPRIELIRPVITDPSLDSLTCRLNQGDESNSTKDEQDMNLLLLLLVIIAF